MGGIAFANCLKLFPEALRKQVLSHTPHLMALSRLLSKQTLSSRLCKETYLTSPTGHFQCTGPTHWSMLGIADCIFQVDRRNQFASLWKQCRTRCRALRRAREFGRGPQSCRNRRFRATQDPKYIETRRISASADAHVDHSLPCASDQLPAAGKVQQRKCVIVYAA